MPTWRELRATIAATLAPLLACPPASALVALNDGHDRIFITGTLSASHDSNIYANSDNRGDVIYSTRVVADYTRRAGWIGVNASAAVESAEFAELKEENYQNPSYTLEFTKQSGRTTGALSLSAARESRADAAVNVRSTSWNYASDLQFKYPIVGLYTLTGRFGYSAREYVGASILANLYTYHASADVLRILGPERDLMGGYRYRYSETSFDTTSTDHSLTLGIAGKLIRGLAGSVRAGYQIRSLDTPREDDGTFGSWTASGSVTYPFNKKTSVSAQLSKDFSITANDSSVDVTAASLDLQYAFSSRWSFGTAATWGRSRFQHDSARARVRLDAPLLAGGPRVDTYASWDAGVTYTLNEHLQVAVTYVWFENWSTLAYADFARSSWTARVSSRW